MIDRLVVLGAGDVVTRYLVPALAELEEQGQLSDDLTVVVVGRDDHDDEWLRGVAGDAAAEQRSADRPPDPFLDRLHYHVGDATVPDDLRGLVDVRPVVVYLALPAQVFPDAVTAVIEADVHSDSRIVIEKPFGEDAESATALNDLLHERFDEHDVIRVDHFLGLQTTRNIVAARFANRLFEPVWNRDHVERIEVVWDETLALEGRAGYYEGTGAARDMLQNHLLQLLCLAAMDQPDDYGHDGVADRKVEVLRALRPQGDVVHAAVRARYTAGRVDGDEIRGYLEEEGVDEDSTTETFAEFTMEIATDRWAGVPMRIRSGKALGQDRHEVAVHFRPADHGITTAAGECIDVVRFQVGPDAVALSLQLSDGAAFDDVAARQLVYALPPAELGPYALLLREVLTREPGMSVRDDEAVASWEAVAPLLQAFDRGTIPMGEYPAGSGGPGSTSGAASSSLRSS